MLELGDGTTEEQSETRSLKVPGAPHDLSRLAFGYLFVLGVVGLGVVRAARNEAATMEKYRRLTTVNVGWQRMAKLE
jgi:hypothetical protein